VIVNKLKIAGMLAIALLLFSSIAFGQTKEVDIAGFSTLLVSPSARHAAMGEATGATAHDLLALYSNPAGIARATYFSVGAAHVSWIADYRSEFVGIVYHPSNFAIGSQIYYGTVGDIERRSGPSDQPEGYFDLNDIVAGLSIAYQAGDLLTLGITPKLVYQKLDIYSSTGIAFDFGMQYQVMPDLLLGASFANLGTKLKFKNEEYDLPRIFRGGVSYLIRDFQISGEVFYPTDDEAHLHIGGQYNINDMFYLRSGFQSGYDDKSVSFGLGFAERGFNINYAYVPFKSDLGDTHRIAITYSLLKED
jgi:hypothetical protein